VYGVMGGEPAQEYETTERDLTQLDSALAALSFFCTVCAGNDPASKITITLAFTSVTAGNRF